MHEYNKEGIWYKRNPSNTVLFLKIIPNASRTEVGGVLGNRLKIRISAPAESGQANAMLIDFLSRKIAIRKRDIKITFGNTSPEKNIIIDAPVDVSMLI